MFQDSYAVLQKLRERGDDHFKDSSGNHEPNEDITWHLTKGYDGDFRQICHLIISREMASLAERLGLIPLGWIGDGPLAFSRSRNAIEPEAAKTFA